MFYLKKSAVKNLNSILTSNHLLALICAEFLGRAGYKCYLTTSPLEGEVCFPIETKLKSGKQGEGYLLQWKIFDILPRPTGEAWGEGSSRRENSIPSPTGGRLEWGITHREKTNVMAGWFCHRIDCRRNLLPMRFRVKHGMTEVGGVVCYQ